MEFSLRRSLRPLVLATLIMSCVRLLAQADVSGNVVDSDGAAVPNAEVHLRTSHGGPVNNGSTLSDTNGHFHLLHIAPGNYQLQIPARYGFDLYQAPIHIAAGVSPSLHIQLVPASVAENVTVASETNQVDLDAATNRDQVSTDAKMLEKVPVFDQNYIAALTPFLDQTGVATAGVTIIVDGVEMKGTGVSASAIAEAHINNDPYSAETNRPGKGRIEIITKPGTPQIHGTLNFTFRDSVFDAKNYFALSKPFEQKRIYEGSITGPLGFDHKTTFLLSGTRQEDNLQSIIHADTPPGIVGT